MKEGAPHPKSGPYRENKEAVEAHAERLAADAPEWMFPEHALGYALTDEEREDVANFAEYAAMRLSAGAVSAPGAHDLLRRGRPDLAFKEYASGSHDLWHAAVRYRTSGGESLVPAYMRPETRLAQAMDRDSLAEEAIVEILEPDGPRYASIMLKALAEGKDLKEVIVSLAGRQYPEMRELVESAEDAKSDPALYFAKLHLMTYFANLESLVGANAEADGFDGGTAAAVEKYWDVCDSMLADPDPEYLRIVRARYESELGENRDPRFAIHEFRSMLAPLLARLKLKKLVRKFDAAKE